MFKNDKQSSRTKHQENEIYSVIKKSIKNNLI